MIKYGIDLRVIWNIYYLCKYFQILETIASFILQICFKNFLMFVTNLKFWNFARFCNFFLSSSKPHWINPSEFTIPVTFLSIKKLFGNTSSPNEFYLFFQHLFILFSHQHLWPLGLPKKMVVFFNEFVDSMIDICQ